MFNDCVYPCARSRGRLASALLALLVLIGLDYSHSFATSINFSSIFGSSSSTNIKVVEKAGPIDVEYDFIGTHNDLPTIEIKEKLRQPDEGGQMNLWSDVELEICIVRGSDDSVIDKIDDAIDDIKDLIDQIFGSWGKKTTPTTSTSSSHHPEPDGEDDWDFIDIGVDKFVKNKAGVLLTNYRMVLGTGLGNDFVPSDPNDGLYFLSTPMPKETTDYFVEPPLADDPYSDYLHWTADGVNHPGFDNYEQAAFWFGVHVPRGLFVEDSHDPDKLRARFTIRQHAEVPEPTALGLVMLGLIAGSAHRRRR